MMVGAALLACAVGVAPSTMAAVVQVESGGNPFAVHVNRWTGEQPRPRSLGAAVAVAETFIKAGYSVDLGLGQLNSAHLSEFGYNVLTALDGCRNLAASGMVLSSFYTQAVQQFGEGQRALQSALSGYNTGSLVKGFSNGYVARYYINAPLPAMVARTAPPVRLDTIAYDRPGYSLVIQ